MSHPDDTARPTSVVVRDAEHGDRAVEVFFGAGERARRFVGAASCYGRARSFALVPQSKADRRKRRVRLLTFERPEDEIRRDRGGEQHELRP